MAGERIDTTQATILGWTGWIVPLILVIVLLATGQFAPATRRTIAVSESERA